MQNYDDNVARRTTVTVPVGPRGALYGLAAEMRAVEQGHRARLQADGSILVKSDSQGGSYRVRVHGVEDGVLVFDCTCPSGDYRAYLPVPCKHAALVGRRLEREGRATWQNGTWRPREQPARTDRPAGQAA
jgi:hypothetical protein